MNKTTRLILVFASAACVAGASAQPAGMQGMGGMGLGSTTTCRDALDAVACEARREAQVKARRLAMDGCKDVVGTDRRRCISDLRMVGQDCAEAGNPARCEQVNSAHAKCRHLAGPAMRACMSPPQGTGNRAPQRPDSR
jgi:hypothetical protein